MKKDNTVNNATVANQCPFLQTYLHGTKADLKIGDFIETGIHSNYGRKKKAKYIYLTPAGTSHCNERGPCET